MLLNIFSLTKSEKSHDFISMLLDLETSDVNKQFDSKQYNSSDTKFLEKKLTHKVRI